MNIFKYIAKIILLKPLYNALIFLVWVMPGNSLGLAVIALTIVIKLILLPSSLKSTVAQKKLQDLQPQMEALKNKYKDDKQKQSKALMEFYSHHKVNPFSSCLPILLQLPILVIMYYVFRIGLDTSRFDLLYSFVPRPETVNSHFLWLNLGGFDPYYILPILTALTTFAYSWQMKLSQPKPDKKKAKSTDPSAQMQRMLNQQMIFLMPVMTLIIALRLPAALPLYWVVSNLFMMFQQWLVTSGKIGKAPVKVSIKQPS